MEKLVEKLALHGGERSVNYDGKHFIWPEITNETKEAVLKQLERSISIYDRSGIIEELENRLANYFGVKHALLTNSGTQALHSMYVGAELKEGDEVLVPAYTFFATVTPIFSTGAIPVLVDCGDDGNIDPDLLEKHTTKRTKGIVITHMWGRPCSMDEILKFANTHKLRVFEDVSHAFGATYKNKQVGSFGEAAALSLQGSKTITGGEGGVLLTNNSDLYYRALLIGHYNKRCKQEIPKEHKLSKYSVSGMGMKYRIHPLAAAIINQQMDNISLLLEGREKIASYMTEQLKSVPGIEVIDTPGFSSPSWYSFMMKYNSNDLGGLPIEKFFSALQAEGCNELDIPGSTCALNLLPLFQSPGELYPHYQGKVSHKKGDFPIAERWTYSYLKLPVWHNDKDLDLVEQYINAFHKVARNYKCLL